MAGAINMRMAQMPYDTGSPLATVRGILTHPDTGTVPRPPGLIGVKQAAHRYGVSERTVRLDCREHGIAIVDGKGYLVVIQAADAFYANDTGPLHHYQRDIELVRWLTGLPLSPSTRAADAPMPAAWNTSGEQEASMQQVGFTPSQGYPEMLRLRLPEGMQATLQYAARRRALRTSDWIRQALLDRLHQEGLVLMDTGAVRRTEDL
jgi:hypothetical protein